MADFRPNNLKIFKHFFLNFGIFFHFFSPSWSELNDIRPNRVRVNEVKLYFQLFWSLFIKLIGLIKFYANNLTGDSLPVGSPVALQLRPPPPKVSARAPAHRSYHFRGVKLKSCIKKIHHNLYISKQANVRIKHANTEGASHKKFGTDARVQ